MTHYEGILVSSNDVINTSAAGAEINDESLYLKIYLPSDTGRNLQVGKEFTFSLTDSIRLFYLASLKGHNQPEKPEVPKSKILEKDGYYFPKEAGKTYFCTVKNISKKEGNDKYGEFELKKIKAKIDKKEGQGDFLTRENPYLDSLVYASRIHVADEKEKEKIQKKVRELMKDKETELAKIIISYVEGEIK